MPLPFLKRPGDNLSYLPLHEKPPQGLLYTEQIDTPQDSYQDQHARYHVNVAGKGETEDSQQHQTWREGDEEKRRDGG